MDNNLRFEKHVSNICLTANRKLSTLTRVAKFVPLKKRRILFKAQNRTTISILHTCMNVSRKASQ